MDIATTRSNGLLGLSHFRNSRVATSLSEPIYQNLFAVSIVPPDGIEDRSDERMNIILEGVQSVGTITASKASSPVEQKYKFATRSYASAVPDSTTIDLEIEFMLNVNMESGTPDNYTYKFLRQWVDLIYDPLTGHQGIKKDYVAPSITVTMYTRNNLPLWQWIFYYCWPTKGAPQPSLNYTNAELMKGSMTFRCDWWDECML